jgi:hypothetical protein
MAQFIVVDHSLKGEGGHHLDYDCNVLLAAERAGFAPVLATHRRFRSQAQIPPHWPVYSLFRHHAYSRYSVLTGKAKYPALIDEECSAGLASVASASGHSPGASPGLWAGIQRRWHRWQIGRRRDSFADACRRLFGKVSLQTGDQVFFPTMTEFDLVGLAQFLQTFPQRESADWHVLFHHGFFPERGPRQNEHEQIFAAMKTHFQQIRELVGDARLHCHATTLPLARQYDSLEAFPCHELAYAVTTSRTAQGDSSADSSPHPGPLRFALAGGVRQEKGHSHLAKIVAELQKRPVLASRCQFWVQSKHPFTLDSVNVFDVSLADLRENRIPGDPLVVRIPHPLPDDDYHRLFTQIDVGLFLHDPRRYLSRCSGVLVEMLAAGLPVIVPAGCWLAGELTPAVTDRWQEILDDSAQCGDPSESEGHLTIPISATEHEVELKIPPKAGYLLLEYATPTVVGRVDSGADPLEDNSNGCLTATAAQLDHAQSELRRWGLWFDAPSARQTSKGIIPVHPFAKTVKLTWKSPVEQSGESPDSTDSSGSPRSIRIHYRYRRDARPLSMPGPVSSVGITALDLDDLIEQFEELIRHFPHYRETASQFGRAYAYSHHPDRVVERLAQVSAAARV